MSPWRVIPRLFLKSPGWVAAAVATLAVGLGANVLVFSVAQAVLLRPLGFVDEDRLMWVRLAKARSSMSDAALSWREVEDFQASIPAFAAVSTFAPSGMIWEETDPADAGEVPVLRVRSELSDVLQVRPSLGRWFRPEEIAVDEPVVLVSHRAWQTRFGGEPGILGRTVRLDGKVHEIVGVLPDGLKFPMDRAPRPGTGSAVTVGDPVFWLPMKTPGGEDLTSRESRMFSVVARLKPGVDGGSAQAQLEVLGKRLAAAHPESNRDVEYTLVSFRSQVLGRARQGIPLLMGAVAAVLLVCCVNLANLLLARGLTRRREISVRLALGASRRRLMGEAMLESLILAGLGGAAGVALAGLGLHGVRQMAAASVPFVQEARLDGPVLVFALAASGISALISGWIPAWHQSRTEVSHALRTGVRSTGDAGIRRWQSMLLTAQVAAVLVLLTAAGALLESFRRLLGEDPGYQAQSVVTLDLRTRGFETNGDVCRFYRRLREQIAGLPGVEAVGTISSVPLTGGWTFAEKPDVVGRPLPEADRPAVAATFVAFDYFQAMGIPLLEGRMFRDAELDDHGYGRQVLLNATAAGMLFPGRSAVGGRFTVGSNPDRVLEVIGVVKDTRDVRLEEAPVPRFYWQYAFGGAQVVVRARGDAGALIPMLRDAVPRTDVRVQVAGVRRMTEIMEGTLADRRFLMWMMSGYAALALGVAVLGVFGVVSFQVAQQRTEFGVRLALGGLPSHLQRLVLARSARLVMGGIAAGGALSLATNRLLEGQVYGVSPHDPRLLLAAAAALVAAALAAGVGPARQAARLQPVDALREG